MTNHNVITLDDDRDGNGVDDFTQTSNPFAPGEDYLPVRVRISDTGKINNGNNCAVCHTTQVRAGDFSFYSPTHGAMAEKTFHFKKGTNYPISLIDFVQSLPRPNGDTGSPTTTEKYSVEFLASSNTLPAQFFVADPQSRLGIDKVWLTSFPTPAQNPVGTLTVPRIDITFTNVAGNTPLDTNSNWNGGMRVFPDQISPTDMTARNVVRVRVTTTPAMPGKQVRLKSFDVDDATLVGSVDDMPPLIDTNDVPFVVEKGNDNRGIPQAGTLAQTLLTLDGTGAAETQLTLPMQPGDNMRVAALFETNQAQSHLDSLQVTNSNAAFYVTNSNDQIKDYLGGVSPMLTVWRRLNLEFDSMLAEPISGAEAIFLNTTVVGYSDSAAPAGQSFIRVRGPFVLTTFNQFERGILDVAAIGRFRVLANTSFAIPGSTNSIYSLTIDGRPGTNTLDKTAKLYDDDNQYLQNDPLYPSLLNIAAPLPADTRSTEFMTNMQPRYADAYIQLVDANAAGWNTQPTIPFKRHRDLPIPIFPDDFDRSKLSLYEKDRAGFWAYPIVVCYEGSSWEDGDPDREDPVNGNNAKWPVTFIPNGLVAIYLEAIRDDEFGIRENKNIGRSDFSSSNPIVIGKIRRDYFGLIYGVIAHEVGHAPGRRKGAADHAEGGLMIEGGSELFSTGFSAKTILRFRKCESWTN